MNIIKQKENLIARIQDKEHRDAFVSSRIQVGIPLQIRGLREKRGWSQQELADYAKVKQSWIATIENPNYSGFSLKTLLKLASVFEVGLIVEFVPISNLVESELRLSPESLTPVSFDEDPYFKPQAINIPCQMELQLGFSGSLESPTQKDSQETGKMGKLYFLQGRQRKTIENKLESQEEKDMPLRNSLIGGMKQ
ncbi:MAG: helix-turn-helix domain-containing protein [Desulfobaccales bacterium]